MGRSSQMTGPFGGRRWIRTIEAKTQQIYSLPPLATRELSQIQFLPASISRVLYYYSTGTRKSQVFFSIFSGCSLGEAGGQAWDGSPGPKPAAAQSRPGCSCRRTSKRHARRAGYGTLLQEKSRSKRCKACSGLEPADGLEPPTC